MEAIMVNRQDSFNTELFQASTALHTLAQRGKPCFVSRSTQSPSSPKPEPLVSPSRSTG